MGGLGSGARLRTGRAGACLALPPPWNPTLCPSLLVTPGMTAAHPGSIPASSSSAAMEGHKRVPLLLKRNWLECYHDGLLSIPGVTKADLEGIKCVELCRNSPNPVTASARA